MFFVCKISLFTLLNSFLITLIKYIKYQTFPNPLNLFISFNKEFIWIIFDPNNKSLFICICLDIVLIIEWSNLSHNILLLISVSVHIRWKFFLLILVATLLLSLLNLTFNKNLSSIVKLISELFWFVLWGLSEYKYGLILLGLFKLKLEFLI